ncbi:unnamed protein product [Periconia digitata]|uniref:Uncharacterized protein n=1 Tax=Periconia digitata TaxID=1303443 RepID=A0A9W4URC5_9PLEO|nr:unnamed protein product [Periconia digitata]
MHIRRGIEKGFVGCCWKKRGRVVVQIDQFSSQVLLRTTNSKVEGTKGIDSRARGCLPLQSHTTGCLRNGYRTIVKRGRGSFCGKACLSRRCVKRYGAAAPNTPSPQHGAASAWCVSGWCRTAFPGLALAKMGAAQINLRHFATSRCQSFPTTPDATTYCTFTCTPGKYPSFAIVELI